MKLVNLRKACHQSCLQTHMESPISPSSSAFGTNAATLSNITKYQIHQSKPILSMISKASFLHFEAVQYTSYLNQHLAVVHTLDQAHALCLLLHS